ncbi:hypothetical protein DXC23_04495 [Eubacterium sp. OM08-24]|jgi:hypothetical protein|uniref:hypothetical protein n=1 Tax=Eubacterium sp. OM08-24 TaxID=2292352 RepID=UPI000E44B889|nr:hypothetical protein [Eubacterium sp. OM08-24]RGM22312.1 hypothetical protein DXC23_04495 [Eubacterium sp. OM08-24]
MEFKVFAKKLKNVIGGKSNTKLFTKTIFETMMNESGPELLADTSLETFKSYFNGNTSISKVAALILANLNESDEFPSYLEGFGETTAQLLADEFKNDIPDINSVNASFKITDLFFEILREAAGKEKSTQKSADKTPHDILEEKILASGQAIADAWGNAVSNLVNGLDRNSNAGTTSVRLPEEQPNESLYSSEDNLLLEEFTADYDEIMVILIGENYAASLIDMTLPCKIKDLYETKWMSKADTFADPSLKSYVFGLLGELNNISNSFLVSGSTTPFLGSSRTKIRNLYVKLHPDQFAGTFPYDAFIDDWDDGENY